MENLLDFILLREPNVRYVVLGIVLFAAASSVVGSFTYLRKRSLIGDAIAHAVLPGICLAFIAFNTKSLWVLLIGAVITGWLSLLAIDVIVNKSKIKADAAIGLVLSVFFGAGILLLTFIQNSGNAGQSGLDRFLFGSAATIGKEDILTFAILSIALIIVVLLFYKEFKLIAFDREYAVSIGIPVRFLELVLSTVTVFAVAVGIQAVGVVLMSAMLITPAAGARYWTNKLHVMILLSIGLSIVAALGGAYVSYTVPSMPTGPWMIVIISVIAVGSLLIAPERGVLARVLRTKRVNKKILEENVLKIFYHLGESTNNFRQPRFTTELLKKREMPKGKMQKGLSFLSSKQLISKGKDTWTLTEKGFNEARRIIRIHRLWELYLTKYLRIAEDHVHDDAEAIEHVITPELEAKLVEELGAPMVDPHGKMIEY